MFTYAAGPWALCPRTLLQSIVADWRRTRRHRFCAYDGDIVTTGAAWNKPSKIDAQANGEEVVVFTICSAAASISAAKVLMRQSPSLLLWWLASTRDSAAGVLMKKKAQTRYYLRHQCGA